MRNLSAEQVKAETELIDFDEPHTVADPNDFEIVQTHPIAI